MANVVQMSCRAPIMIENIKTLLLILDFMVLYRESMQKDSC